MRRFKVKRTGNETVVQISEDENVNFHHLGFVYFSKETGIECLKRLLKTYRFEELTQEEELYFLITSDENGITEE